MPPQRLVVDVRTDLLPGVEFDSIAVRLADASGLERGAQISAADPTRSYVARRRVAEWNDLPDGDWNLVVALCFP